MTRDDLIAAFTDAAARHDAVEALLLAGSLGRGEGDAWSDVDLVVVTPPAAHAGFVEGLRAWAGGVAEPVLWRQVYPGLPIFLAVTADYLRYDLTVTTAERVAESADRVWPLVDKAGVVDGLAPSRDRPPLSPRAIRDVVEEFLRILGLMPVAMGRADYPCVSAGLGLLRQQLQALMVLEQRPVTPPGALAVGRLLPPADRATLTTLAGLTATTRETGVAANLAVAEVFLRRARPLAEAAGAAWPDALEAAVRGHLARELGVGLSA